VSCAATICHFPARLSHVSVQTWQRFVSLPSLLSLIILFSAPYATAMESPKNLTFTSPSWQSRDRDFVSVVIASSLPYRWPFVDVP
jgi:hypothetical protein